MRKIAFGGAAVALGVLAACGGGGSSNSSSGGGAASSSAASSSAASSSGGSSGGSVVATGSTNLGTVLTNAQGFTLYYFVPEQGSKVVCTGSCAMTWPPLVVTGTPSAPSGASGTFATVTLSDGTTMEATYNGWPLHTYSGDTAAGQTNGQGIAGKWYAATPGLTANGGGTSSGGSTSGTPSYGGY